MSTKCFTHQLFMKFSCLIKVELLKFVLNVGSRCDIFVAKKDKTSSDNFVQFKMKS